MKILEVVFNLSPGGAERFVVDLSNELSKTNEVTLLAIKDDSINPEFSLFYKSELSNRVTYKNLDIAKGYSLSIIRKVYKAIKQESARIVHIHGEAMPYYCILALLFLNRKCKIFQTIHSDIHNGYDTLFYKILFKTLGYSHRIGFVALSETNYKDMMKEYPKAKATCIPNGRAQIKPSVEYNKVKTEMDSYRQQDESMLFLHVARCAPVKNQTMLVEAFNQFVERGNQADLVLVGAGYDSELGQSIQNKAGKKIHFIGTRKNIGDYMLNADVFCLSSDYEGMPITLLEASLAGLPIVSTPVCGAVDVVNDKKNGVLSNDHSVESYLEALEYAYAHQKELKDEAIRRKDISEYTIEACAKQYMDFFMS